MRAYGLIVWDIPFQIDEPAARLALQCQPGFLIHHAAKRTRVRSALNKRPVYLDRYCVDLCYQLNFAKTVGALIVV
jgi:hypothetical protein